MEILLVIKKLIKWKILGGKALSLILILPCSTKITSSEEYLCFKQKINKINQVKYIIICLDLKFKIGCVVK